MNQPAFYPQIDTRVTTAIKGALFHMKQDPHYLLRAECQYAPDVKELLTKLYSTEQVTLDAITTQTENMFRDGESLKIMMEQSERIYSKLATMEQTLTNNPNPEQKFNFYKNLTVMLEKIITLRQKAEELHDVHTFKAHVRSILADVLTAEQRQKFIELLEQ